MHFSTLFTIALMACSFAFVASIPVVRRQTETGQATWYEPGLGACGISNTASDYVVAVSESFYDSFPGATANPNDNPICRKSMVVNYQGKSVTVEVVDRCEGCAYSDIDLSPAAFEQLADLSVGRLSGVTWTLN